MDYVFLFAIPTFFVFSMWVGLPLSFFVIRPRPKCYFYKNPDTSINKWKKKTIQDLQEKLEGQGFTELGIRVEKLPLWGRYRLLDFTSASDHTFASIYVSFGRVIYYFYTPFSDGRVVLTANSAFHVIADDEVLQSAVAATRPDDLLAIHQKQVELFRSKGSQFYEDFAQNRRVEATYQYYNATSVRRRVRLSGLTWLVAVIVGIYPFVSLLVAALSEP